ncbi:hypothetical protein LOTGIDRAFT_108137 [Lottia gigantea]|uniref:Uncharacterized protein n=1 Tax=Lottia gigantea TaxID=225164 RepID=V3ZNA1_LOTGI|nr:hypothetical protein LOTGIDRAFT_108137 [Lottia gigantea]ESO83920.1 hypothetical protein LOTGIDRAFT_108137 [Lottia gigantea]
MILFQKEPLYFNYDTSKVSPEMAEVMDSIKQLGEQLLFHWRTFPIHLPPSLTELNHGPDNPDEPEFYKSQKKSLFEQLFIAPTFDELDEVALNQFGGIKRLSDKQLDSVWNHGEFEVDSIHFPGQTHKWRLTQLLQKGTVRAHDTLLDDSALSLRLLIITARNRFQSHFFSLSQSFKGWTQGIWKLLDVLFGMPSTTSGDLSFKVREEHMQYLVAELTVRPNHKQELSNYCDYVKEQSRLLRTDRYKVVDGQPPQVPYRYQTPKGLEIDLRLFNKDLINNCLPILSNILDRESKGWHIQYRQKCMREIKDKNLSAEAMNEKMNESVMKEYLRRVYQAILNNAELDNLQPGIGELLIAQAQTVIALRKAVENLQSNMQKHKEQLIKHLKKQYPVKSRIRAWMNEQLDCFEEEFITQNLWSAHEEATSLCEEQDLQQAVYFIKRDINFIKERESVLKKELSKVKQPNRQYTFNSKIWFPSNYIIKRYYRGESVVIPTVFKETSISSAAEKDIVPRYDLEKYVERRTTTRHPFWRWWNYLQRTWTWMWNSMFFFGIVIPWCSPISLRALFLPKSFTPDYQLSQFTGALHPCESSRTQTLTSRLQLLWQHVRKSRKDFEEAPDTGFLGKSLSRHINRFWNYVIKGSLGSLLIVLVFPTVALVSSLLSITLALTCPVWVPVVTLIAHLGFILVYDIDCPEKGVNRFFCVCEAVIWNIIIQGCLQPIAAFITGAIICPTAAFFVIFFGLLRRTGRGLWDTFMFQTIIKSRGRVPARDGFVARRISGPGLASNYFFQIRPEQALAAVESQMEKDELEAWKVRILKIIEEPKDVYKKFVSNCFEPFSAEISNQGVYKKLCQETLQYSTDLRTKVDERERKLRTGLYPDFQRRIKLPEGDLKLTVLYTAKLLESFYPEHVIKRLLTTEEEYWESQHLEFRDWKGLACKKLSDIFTRYFLMPLEETDNSFELKVEHLNLSRYVDMLAKSEYHDDLYVVSHQQSPPASINVKAPYLDCGYFNPTQRLIHTTRFAEKRAETFQPLQPHNNPIYTQASRKLAVKIEKRLPWKRRYEGNVFDKLEIPLPIPHPVNIAIAIYNRSVFLFH